MTDNVYIEDINPDALSKLPKWATEDTLVKLLKTMQDTMKMQNTQFNKLESSLRKFTGQTPDTETNDNKSNIGQFNDELADAIAFAEKEAEQNRKKRKHWESENKQATLGEKLFGKMSKSATIFNSTLSAIDIVSAAGVKAMYNNVQSYANLYNSGLALTDMTTGITDGFYSFQNLVIQANVRLNDLNKTLMKYSTTVTVYGTQKFIKTSVMAQQALTALGFSAAEGMEFVGSYLDSMKGFTNVVGLSAEQQSKSAINFANSVRTMSLLTGQSTQELMSKFKELAKTVDANILSSQIGAKSSSNLMSFISTLKDQNLGKQLLSTITAPIKEIDGTVNALLSSGQGQLAQQYKEVTQRMKVAAESGVPPEEIGEMWRQFSSNAQLSSAAMQNLQLQNTEAAKTTLAFATSLSQSSRDIAKLDSTKRGEIEKDKAAAAARAKIATQWDGIISKFVGIFTPSTEMLEVFGNGLEYINNAMKWVADSLQGSSLPTIFALVGTVLGGLISGVGTVGRILTTFGFQIGSALTSFSGWILSLLNPITKLVAAFAAGYALGTLLYELVADFKWFSSMMDTIFEFLDRTVLQHFSKEAEERVRNRDAAAEENKNVKISEKSTVTETSKIAKTQVNTTHEINKAVTKINAIKEPARSVVHTAMPKSSEVPAVSTTANTPTKVITEASTTAPAKEPEINSILKYQNILLEQLLDKQGSILTMNRDMLKVSRNS